MDVCGVQLIETVNVFFFTLFILLVSHGFVGYLYNGLKDHVDNVDVYNLQMVH